MKNKLLSKFTVILAATAFIFAACSKDKCEEANCQNNAKCTDGTCLCENGFTGSKCETAPPLPTASFIMDKLSCKGRCTVSFTSTGSYGSTYLWEVKNNSINSYTKFGSGKQITYDFKDAGEYTIKHTVSNGSGDISSIKNISISPDGTTDPKTQVSVRVNNSSKNRYQVEINGSYVGVVAGNGSEVYYATPGSGKLFALQLEGYVFTPTKVEATYSGTAGSSYVWNIP